MEGCFSSFMKLGFVEQFFLGHLQEINSQSFFFQVAITINVSYEMTIFLCEYTEMLPNVNSVLTDHLASQWVSNCCVIYPLSPVNK